MASLFSEVKSLGWTLGERKILTRAEGIKWVADEAELRQLFYFETHPEVLRCTSQHDISFIQIKGGSIFELIDMIIQGPRTNIGNIACVLQLSVLDVRTIGNPTKPKISGREIARRLRTVG